MGLIWVKKKKIKNPLAGLKNKEEQTFINPQGLAAIVQMNVWVVKPVQGPNLINAETSLGQTEVQQIDSH